MTLMILPDRAEKNKTDLFWSVSLLAPCDPSAQVRIAVQHFPFTLIRQSLLSDIYNKVESPLLILFY